MLEAKLKDFLENAHSAIPETVIRKVSPDWLFHYNEELYDRMGGYKYFRDRNYNFTVAMEMCSSCFTGMGINGTKEPFNHDFLCPVYTIPKMLQEFSEKKAISYLIDVVEDPLSFGLTWNSKTGAYCHRCHTNDDGEAYTTIRFKHQPWCIVPKAEGLLTELKIEYKKLQKIWPYNICCGGDFIG